MVFIIKNKVALVTGGASGIGLEHVKQLLKKGAKGVTIADINENGEAVVKELEKEFSANRLLFVLTDVSSYTSFESAFKLTIEKFKNIDILINNAGICRDSDWSNEIDINLKGSINGLILGLEKYIKEYKQDEEGVIINTSSVGALIDFPTLPIYCATKQGILTLTRCWGQEIHYERTKVKVIAICPGITNTTILDDVEKIVLKPHYVQSLKEVINMSEETIQSVNFVSEETMKLIEGASNGSVWVIEESKPAYQYIQPDKNSFEKNVLK